MTAKPAKLKVGQYAKVLVGKHKGKLVRVKRIEKKEGGTTSCVDVFTADGEWLHYHGEELVPVREVK